MTEIIKIVITQSTGLVVAGITAAVAYLFTKKKERDAELRREKLEHYKELVSCFSLTLVDEDTPDGHRAFARATNNLNLTAPPSVLKALYDFRDEIRIGNSTPSLERQKLLLSNLMCKIREDLGIITSTIEPGFEFRIYASGIKTSNSTHAKSVG
ncbi:MAG: hypothetical protein P4M01_06105 [Acidobacteriota bacterium]|nr:hypothetical protein [Acidobacteriota bacterium]